MALRLHDEVGQWLVFALLHVDRAMASGRELHDALDPVRTGLQRSSQAVRKMIEELDDGMTCAAEGSLQAAIDAALSNSPWSHCPLQLDLDPSLSDIPSAFAPLAARMIGELVGNAHRHAHASQVCLRVRCQDRMLRIRVGDNGDGMPMSSIGTRFGLRSLARQVRRSGGQWDLWSVSGVGTRVTLELPLVEGTP